MLIGVLTTVAIDRTQRAGFQSLNDIIEARQQREESLRQTAWRYAVPMVDLAHKLNLGILDSTTVRFRMQAELRASDASWRSYAEHVPLAQRAQLSQAQERARKAFARLGAVLSTEEPAALRSFIQYELYPAIDPFTTLVEEQMRAELTRTNASLKQTRDTVMQARAQAINVAILAYLVTGFGGAALAFYLIRRVKAIQALSAAIARNDLDLPPALEGGDEIGQIHDNLLAVYERLKVQWDELHAQNDELVSTLADLEQSQSALQANEERWKLALEASESGIWEHDLLRNRVQFSAGWKAQLGFAPAQLHDDFDNWALRLHPDDAPGALTAYKHFVEGQQASYRVEFRLKHKDGSWRWLQSNGSAQHDSGGNVIRVVGTQTDITQRKLAEAALINARDEAEDALLKLQSTQQQMLQSEKLAALGGLVAGIAHEVNTPLGIAVTAASTLHEETARVIARLADGQIKKSELEAFLAHSSDTSTLLLKHIEHAATLIRSFKQISVDQNIDERRLFKPRDYFTDILNSLAPKFRHTPHRFTFDCPPNLELDSYPAAFTQLFTNLVTNALLHGFEQVDAGLLTITVEARGKDTVVLQFSDNGPGIPPGELKRIFEPFFTTKRGRGGSGLGLAIVYNLVVARLGGKITVSSKPGLGTTFTVLIPIIAPGEGSNT
ncbi:ATP-binding protein [Andreprevotia sp. IGB-42]|uniref:ATP-binding protein n=1 Tax=Andreprevotia sp. IGB-42 TaxID=2497473 RepID=UPI001356B01F|nr:ATP-binding protein [Andreprevotia sp. IGB-42]